MMRTVVDCRGKRSRRLLDLVFLVLVLAGMALNLYLLFLRYADAGADIAGCGGASCEEVLASRWSLVFGIPVTVFGALTCLGLLFSITARGRGFRVPLLGTALGVAFWFVFVQAVFLRAFCPWCLAVHGLALALLVTGLRRGELGSISKWGYAAFLGIGLMQLYGPVSATHRIEGPATSVNQAIRTGGEARIVSFDGGRKSFDVSSHPHIGSPDAKRVMVEYFDYQCQSCRVMSEYLTALVDKHPSDICVLLLPVPMDHDCNDDLPAGMEGHSGSCDLSRIALAVWRMKPESFPMIHRAFLAKPPPSPGEAMSLARDFVPASLLDATVNDPRINQLIRSNISDWMSFSGKSDKLPKLLIRDKRILHGLPSSQEEFIRVMERELEMDK